MLSARVALRVARPALRLPATPSARPFAAAAKSSLMGRATGFVVGFGTATIGSYFILVKEITSSTDKLEAAHKKLGSRLQALEEKLGK